MEENYGDALKAFGGVPPLWPHSPRWIRDDDVYADVLRKSGTAGILFRADAANQKRLDQRWSAFNANAAAFSVTLGEKRATTREWNEACARTAGWAGLVASSVGSRDMDALHTKESFVKRYSNDIIANGMDFSMPDGPVMKRPCDKCKTPCFSECAMCGEAFCGVACLKAALRTHRSTCKRVWEQIGCFCSTIDHLEMKFTLPHDEYTAAIGSSSICFPFKTPTSSNSNARPDQPKAKPKAKPKKTRGAGGSADGKENEKNANADAKTGAKVRTCGRCDARDVSWRACGGCRKTYYCGKECQRADWPSHKETCKPAFMYVGHSETTIADS